MDREYRMIQKVVNKYVVFTSIGISFLLVIALSGQNQSSVWK